MAIVLNLCLSLNMCIQGAYVTPHSIPNSSAQDRQFAAHNSGATKHAWQVCASSLIELQPSYTSK